MKSVYVVGEDKLVARMFQDAGYSLESQSPKKLDLVCLTGGSDVSPYLYGEENTDSHTDPIRDEFEREVYEYYVGRVPFVGICRGGQFLNVMNGGKMIQHIKGHQMGTHKVWLLTDGMDEEEYLELHEDHHQGMVKHYSARTLSGDARDDNEEILWYPKTRSLCFQPHPEWGHEPTRKLFFELIDQYIFAGDKK